MVNLPFSVTINFPIQSTKKTNSSDSKSSFKPNTEEELVLIMLRRSRFGKAKGKLVFTMPSVKFLAEGKSHSDDYRSTTDNLL